MRKHRSRQTRIFLILLNISWGVLMPVAAQNFDLGADFIVGIPQNEFRDNIDEEGYGASGHFGYFLGDSPVMVGADFGFLNYGTQSRREPFSDTIPEVTVRVRTTNNILLMHGFLRVQPRSGPVRPYAEGLFGFKYLFTRTAVIDDTFDETIAASTNFDDLARSWGVGAGADIRLWEARRRRGGIADVSLSVGAKYLWGSEAEYLRKGSIRPGPDGITYLVFRSETNMLIPHIGVRIRF